MPDLSRLDFPGGGAVRIAGYVEEPLISAPAVPESEIALGFDESAVH